MSENSNPGNHNKLVSTDSPNLLRSRYAKILFKKTWENLSELQKHIIMSSWVSSHPMDRDPQEIVDVNNNKVDLENHAKRLLKRRTTSTKDWVFMTVNPRPKTDLAQLKNVMENRFEVSHHVDDYMYCYETRGDFNVEDPGLHLHILFQKHEPPSRCIPQIENMFKHFCDNPLHINTQLITLGQVTNIQRYIRGYKRGEPKNNSLNDQAYRFFHGLKSVYGTLC